mgnify:CR=1 FL=1|jgi:hypothetical protein
MREQILHDTTERITTGQKNEDRPMNAAMPSPFLFYSRPKPG